MSDDRERLLDEVRFRSIDLLAQPIGAFMPLGEMPARMPNRVYESMTRHYVGAYTVRVWRDEKSLEPGNNDDIRTALDYAPLNATAPDLVALVEALPRVVAVEVLDDDGNGVLLYPDWT